MINNRIVVLEDEFIIALDIKDILTEAGYEVFINIDNVNDAIRAIDEFDPILVLVDINLHQDRDGIELGKYLLQKDTIPFIYLTSYTDEATLIRVFETRPYAYIVKPFKPQDLLTNIAVVLNNFSHRNIDVIRKDGDLNDDVPFVLKRTVQYINDHINDKITVTDLSNQTKWKSQHFNRLFTKYMGVNPYQYIINKKIEKAKIMLEEDVVPITQISYEFGFKSHSNFCALFKKHTNQTPEKYRISQRIRRDLL